MEKANGFSELGSLGSGRAGIWFAVRLQGPRSAPLPCPTPCLASTTAPEAPPLVSELPMLPGGLSPGDNSRMLAKEQAHTCYTASIRKEKD